MKAVNKHGHDCFIGHAERSVEIARNIMHELRFTRKEINTVTELIRHHDAMSGIAGAKKPEKTIRNFFMKTQKQEAQFFRDLIELKKADFAGQNTEYKKESRERGIQLIESGFARVLDNHIPRRFGDLAINGNDLMRLGVEPKMIPAVQTEMLRTVMDHPVYNTREELSMRDSVRKVLVDAEVKKNCGGA